MSLMFNLNNNIYKKIIQVRLFVGMNDLDTIMLYSRYGCVIGLFSVH